ncbi:MAG: hypothetical protein A3F47_01060 [Candidatus Staskawiczbacteria bacterium RIFCSPHIGHO2_12_FULL_38_11]|uniref:DUF5652 domain-containing protein n=1 Tax=Candidatus Staskawiczbacteria bacterium RIFCSPHIGHO2_12_FULL_38_11 TaxID=1802209 RepID=A0A1G2I8I3_9BACT|nr:MAG: hypothetical protein A3F47_01060 [Candidatus Staskawiczbacteria bacterium RIFCSPHIGHO2_12_FULL_38_11]
MDPQTLQFIELLNHPYYLGLFLLLSIWSLIWKGMALWRASQNNQKHWFIALLIINTFGILEIIYLFYLAKPKKNQDIKNL